MTGTMRAQLEAAEFKRFDTKKEWDKRHNTCPCRLPPKDGNRTRRCNYGPWHHRCMWHLCHWR